jgi:cation diffusion facilitator family transporter
MAGHGTKAILAALFANAGIAVAKFIGFLVTGASSLLAESIHSVADTGNQALLLLGGRRAQREATPAHPFGYGRERYFWSFVVALVLFTLGSLFAVFEGVEKIRHPHELESLGWAIGILLFAIVLESYSFRTAIVESLPHKGNSTWWQFIRQSRQPELPVVLLEDLGALLGLAIALIAVTLSAALDEPIWDGIGTLSIGILLGIIAITLAVEMKSLLLGESATDEDVGKIRLAIVGSPDVVSLIHMRTEHIGPDELLVAAKVEFSHDLAIEELVDRVNLVEAAVRSAVPAARLIYLEPDIRRGGEAVAAEARSTP